jgi:hypothetical protein
MTKSETKTTDPEFEAVQPGPTRQQQNNAPSVGKIEWKVLPVALPDEVLAKLTS